MAWKAVLSAGVCAAAIGWAALLTAQPAGRKPAGATGAFQIAPLGNTAVLIDTRSGHTWSLEKDRGGEAKFVWVPLRRLATDMELDAWRQRVEKHNAERKERR